MEMKQTFPIVGMHCASCAIVIDKTLSKATGVHSVEVNYATEKAVIVYNSEQTNPQTLSKLLKKFGYHLKLDANEKGKINFTPLLIALPIAVLSLVMMAWNIGAQLSFFGEMPEIIKNIFYYTMPIFALYIFISIGRPYLTGLWRFIRYGVANMDTLVGLGTTAAFLYSVTITIFASSLKNIINTEQTYYDVTIIVLVLISLGKYLEARSKLKTGDAIQKLLNLQAKTALIIRKGQEIEIAIDKVQHGDHIIVKPGGKIPVDGTVIEGSSYVDESMISGEPMAVTKNVGDTVIAGTINTTGTFHFKATKVGSETMLAHIISMVEEAQNSKAPIQALADKISGVFVPIVLVLSFIALAAWLLFGIPSLGFAHALSYGLTCFVGILVIACPCALGLATPTAIIVGVGKGAQNGILIKDAATLQKLQSVTTIVMDKTGTLTKGQPELVSFKNYSDKTEEALLSILVSLEQKSEHPLAHAILNYGKTKNIETQNVNNFEAIKGMGLQGTINNQEYFIGNEKLISDLKLNFNTKELDQESSEGKTPIMLAIKGKVLATVFVSDTLKSAAKQSIKQLHDLGIKIVLLTGDNIKTAHFIAKELAIDEVVAEVLPQDKLEKIKQLQTAGNIVAMVGDGINDAPALAQADVGIAMATGTDVAIESAGITLLHGDISKIVKAIRLSKLTMRGIKQNLFWAFIYNIVGIPLAGGLFFPIFGWLLNPIFAGLAMGLSSVSVVSNSLRIKTKKL